MERFSRLFADLDATGSTNHKVALMRDYLQEVAPADGAWAVYLLAGRRMKRLIGRSQLKAWLAEASGLPAWLVDETYQHVGDLAETIVLLLDDQRAGDEVDLPLHRWIEDRILTLRDQSGDEQRAQVLAYWHHLPRAQCFLFTKLLTGSLRVGVSRTLVERALAEATDLPRPVIAHRLMGHWQPDADFFTGLFAAHSEREDASRPYPFFLASPLEGEPAALGALADWAVEWKWDGIRAQLVRRQDAIYLWSRGEELITEQFPELRDAAASLPLECVLDGEILAWWDGDVRPFAELQRRLGRKQLSAKLLAEVPVAFLAFDLLEVDGRDQRDNAQAERRTRLTACLAGADDHFTASPIVSAQDWDEIAALRAESRARGVEGFMLKHRAAAYGVGRRKGAWWKWKVEPLTLDAVLLYAQPGHGRRANLYTDYTFAVWDGDDLIPVAKAYSGLDDGEIRRLDHWIRRHTRERFGPVRSVAPEHVFELAFEGIQSSNRHKSGVALRFPRIARWRSDLAIADADTLPQVRELLNAG